MIKTKNSKIIKRKGLKQTHKSDIQKRIIKTILLMGTLSLLIIFFFGDHDIAGF